MAVTWNPADKAANVTLSNGDLTATIGTDAWGAVRSTISKATGKWYFEIRVDVTGAANYHSVGIGTSAASLTKVGADSFSYGYSAYDGTKWTGLSSYAYGDSYTTGDIVGVAFDLDAGKIWFAKNNAWQASGDPAAGTNEAFSGISGTFFPMVAGGRTTNATTARFSSASQTYSPPTGFVAIEAINLLDGKVRIKDSTTNLLDGKVFAKIKGTNLLDGKAYIHKVATNLLDGKAILTHTAQISATCPTPTAEMTAVFRWVRMQAEVPVPTASFSIGKRIEGTCPTPDLTCTAYPGRSATIRAKVPVPTCFMRTGVKMGPAGVPVPTCSMVADTHHFAYIYGRVPAPSATIEADTENIANISASVPCCRGIFTTTVGNVASIYGRVPCPDATMSAISGKVVSIRGSVPVPGPGVRFHASLMNVAISIEGTVPTPEGFFSVYGLTSHVLRHVRGEVR